MKARVFHKASKKTLKIQKKILKNILNSNHKSTLGENYNFSHIKTISGFLAKVPLANYDEYQTYIHLTSQAKKMIIAEENTLALTGTPGINGKNHYIPLNESLSREKYITLSAWFYYVLSQFKGTKKGSYYFYQAPFFLTRNDDINSKIPVRPENNLDHFPASFKKFINTFQSVPDVVRIIHDPFIFRYVSLIFLLKDSHISLMSISHPAFLIQLFVLLKQEFTNIIEDISQGQINDRLQVDARVKTKILNYLTPDQDRADALRNIFREYNQSEKNISTVYQKIWPKLRLITCQSEGLIKTYQQYLQTLLPDITIQDQGLFTPEGTLSIPVRKQKGQRLAVASHFFEFIDIDNVNKQYSSGKLTTLLAHELREKEFYKILLTNGGGLYRYELPYIVRVVKDGEKCPLIEYICHNHCCANIQGEKLYELDILRIIHNVFRQKGIKPCFYLIAPEKNKKNQDFYVLFLQFNKQQNLIDKKLVSIMELIEKQLLNHNNYAQCRGRNQLGPLGIFLINPNTQPVKNLLKTFQTDKQVFGHIIPSVFHNTFGLSKIFSGQLMTRMPPQQTKTTPKKQTI